MKSANEIAKFIEESIETLKDNAATNCRLILDDDIALFVGWEGGFGDEIRTDCIQDENNPDYAIVAGLKCWRSDDMWTDYEYLNFPYFRNGDVWDSSVILQEGEDFLKLARWFLSEYEALRKYEFRDDGLVLNADGANGLTYDDRVDNLDEGFSFPPILKKVTNMSNSELVDAILDISKFAYDRVGGKEVVARALGLEDDDAEKKDEKDECLVPESFKTVVVDKLPYTSNHEATDGAVYDDFRKQKNEEIIRRINAKRLREQLHPKKSK